MRTFSLAFLALLAGCGTPGDVGGVDRQSQAISEDDPHYQWIFNPVEVDGNHGSGNNCTFNINPACTIDFYPDSSCWEHAAGHGGYYREQLHRLHCIGIPTICGGGEFETEIIRICHEGGGGQETPCGTTGGGGCAVCQSVVTCH